MAARTGCAAPSFTQPVHWGESRPAQRGGKPEDQCGGNGCAGVQRLRSALVTSKGKHDARAPSVPAHRPRRVAAVCLHIAATICTRTRCSRAAHPERRGDLCGEPQLRQPLRHVPRRRRRVPRDGRAGHAARPRRHAAEGADRLRPGRQARPAFSAHAEPALPHRRSAGQQEHRPAGAQPHPRLLPQPGADRRRQEQHVRRDVAGGRMDHGLLRRLAVQAVAMGTRLHAGRPLLHGRLRRLLPEPPVPDLRLCAALSRRTAADARRARRQRQGREAAGLAVGQRRRRADRQRRRRPGHAGRLVRQHIAAVLPAERHRTRRRRPTVARQPAR